MDGRDQVWIDAVHMCTVHWLVSEKPSLTGLRDDVADLISVRRGLTAALTEVRYYGCTANSAIVPSSRIIK